MKIEARPILKKGPRPKRPKQKTTREHEVEDNYRPRLHRSVGVYLALKAWTNGIDCIVLSRKDIQEVFDMKATPANRMEQIRGDLSLWFQGFILSKPKPNNQTFVNFLFLVRRDKDTSYFKTIHSFSGVKLLIEQINNSNDPKAPKTALFSQVSSEGRVPTQGQLLSELVLLVSGLEKPQLREALGNAQSITPFLGGSTSVQMGTSVPNS